MPKSSPPYELPVRVPLYAESGLRVEAAIIDPADASLVNAWGRWYLNAEGYAVCRHRLMHRLVMGVQGPHTVHHKNRIRLDNRRCNLVVMTVQDHMSNEAPLGYSGARGVHFDAKRCKYVARPTINGRRYYLGRFDTVHEALAAIVQFQFPGTTKDDT